MANSFEIWSLAWFGTLLVFTGLPLCRGQATGSCTTVNPCRCTYSDGSYIDLSRISKIGKFKFDYEASSQPGSLFYYAYNPCHPVTDTKQCKNVAACQKNPKDKSGKRYPLGDASSADFTGTDSDISITYSATDDEGTRRTLTVTLECDPTASTPNLQIPGETSTNVYEYTLKSECCCANGCEAVVYSNGLSFGSILCIIFSCLLFVYLVAGVLYMKFIRKAEGKEVIPNYSMWVQVPGLVKDGGKFTYSRIGQLCGKKSPSTYDNI